MLVLLSSCNAASAASSAPVSPSSAPSSVPPPLPSRGLTREEVRDLLAGVELEIGDAKAGEARALARATAAERYADEQHKYAEAEAARAELLPWLAGLGGAAAGAAITAVIFALRAPR